MTLSRREFVVAGLGLLAGGCASQNGPIAKVPDSPWSDGRIGSQPATPPVYQPRYPTSTPSPYPSTPAAASPTAGLRIIPRSDWTGTAPVRSQVNPMNGVSRITVHHEGWTPVFFDDPSTTKKRLQLIQTAHVRDRKWADIGYHYIVDRAGRIWEGRPLQLQGAHVKNQNEHNIGVMLLGNFDEQQPSSAQIASARQVLYTLRSTYRVPVASIYTHQEINPTQCPGKSLQNQMINLRRGGYLG